MLNRLKKEAGITRTENWCGGIPVHRIRMPGSVCSSRSPPFCIRKKI